MADWFKFYENDLDETRLQYAIAQLPEVIPVWVGILSEACRHKSGTIRWGDNEIELFGFSRRLGVPIPKVNEAISLLAKIDYISVEKNAVNILKWKDKQSEYCSKKMSRHTPDSIGTQYGQCPPRGEERRGDKSRKENTKKPVATAPLVREFESFWSAYPRKVGKDAALKKFNQAISKTTIETILLAIAEQSNTEQWKKDGGQFIPHPATWLNQGRWNDTVLIERKPTARQSHIPDATYDSTKDQE
jgi:hypothetical protein